MLESPFYHIQGVGPELTILGGAGKMPALHILAILKIFVRLTKIQKRVRYSDSTD